MKVYRTDAGTWAGTQLQWKERQREEGGDASKVPEPVEIPVHPKADLIQFLNELGGAAPISAPAPATTAPPVIIHTDGPIDLDELFMKAPMKQRMRLAVAAIDAADVFMDKAMAALTARSGS